MSETANKYYCDKCMKEIIIPASYWIIDNHRYCQECYKLNFSIDAQMKNKDEQIAQLKQQLAEKEKEIERLKVYDEYRFELPYPKVKILGKTFEDIQELLDKWLKQGSKDKISFAVDKLVGVQKYISDNAVYVEEECFGREINEYIDKQIKELKEGK